MIRLRKRQSPKSDVPDGKDRFLSFRITGPFAYGLIACAILTAAFLSHGELFDLFRDRPSIHARAAYAAAGLWILGAIVIAILRRLKKTSFDGAIRPSTVLLAGTALCCLLIGLYRDDVKPLMISVMVISNTCLLLAMPASGPRRPGAPIKPLMAIRTHLRILKWAGVIVLLIAIDYYAAVQLGAMTNRWGNYRFEFDRYSSLDFIVFEWRLAGFGLALILGSKGLSMRSSRAFWTFLIQFVAFPAITIGMIWAALGWFYVIMGSPAFGAGSSSIQVYPGLMAALAGVALWVLLTAIRAWALPGDRVSIWAFFLSWAYLFNSVILMAGMRFPAHRRLKKLWRPARLPRLKSPAAKRGMTLIELLIAIAIIGISCAGIAHLAGTNQRAAEMIQARRAALALAEDEIALLRAGPSLPAPGQYPLELELAKRRLASLTSVTIDAGPTPGTRAVTVNVDLIAPPHCDKPVTLRAIVAASGAAAETAP